MNAHQARVWPESIWSAAILRGLDARARSEIAAAGALSRMRAGDAIYSPGEPADAVYIVADGAVAVRAVRRGDVESSLIRDARRGDAFGEEATLGAGVTRRMEARATAPSTIAAIPMHVLRRALARGDVHGAVARVERTLRRAATRDLLGTLSFARGLPDADLDALLDAIEHVHLARGEILFREGDRATHAHWIASGMLQLQTEDLARVHVRAYVGEGDFVGDEEVLQGGVRPHAAVASGPTWVLAVPRDALAAIAARSPVLLDRARRVRATQDAVVHGLAAGAMTTQHVFRDLYRLHVARSLLVIDQNACVRCGHCTWSCGDAHDDGVSRLVRRGDKILAGQDDARPLLVPNSCQHCENPSCMPDCPTGAIGRDLRGEVFIREDLCTGCGSCAKGCPWDNIQLAPRAGRQVAAPRRTKDLARALSPEVAVKCDLCRGASGGPACVAACPTQAIARVDPNEALVELRVLRGDKRAPSPIPRPSPAWPWIVMGAGLAVACARLMPRAPMVSGAIAGATITALAAYAVLKRWPRTRATPLRPWTIAHVALGVVAVGATVAHAGARVPSNAAGGLQLAVWGALLTGCFGAIVYRIVPPLLTRIERGGALPEDLAPRARELDERAFAGLTGRSELLKTIYARLLRPYARNPFGGFMLAFARRGLRDEERYVRARIDAATAGRKSDKLEGLDELVRAVVERRAIGAQRAMQALLRGWLPLHVALSAVAIALLVLHVVIALKYR